MRLPNPVCLWQAFWFALTAVIRDQPRIDGCIQRDILRLNNCTVTVSSCVRCSKPLITWERTERTTDEPYGTGKRIGINA